MDNLRRPFSGKFWRRSSPSTSNNNSSSGGTARSSASATSQNDAANEATFQITIPDNVQPGEIFQAAVGDRIVRVRCPDGARPGRSLQITIKLDSNDINQSNGGMGSSHGSEEMLKDSENVTRIPDKDLAPGETSAFSVEIPKGVGEEQDFSVRIDGETINVKCPKGGKAGMSIRVNPSTLKSGKSIYPNNQPETQRFEVIVPFGVEPGKPFTLLAGGVRVLVTCPRNAVCGQRIQFDLPIELVNQSNEPKSEVAQIKLSYDKDGWTRTVRADLKFQWARFDERGNVDQQSRFDTDRSAYVLKLDYLNDNRTGMRQGHVSLVTPENGVVDSNITSVDGRVLASYSDIASAQTKEYNDKVNWFRGKCKELAIEGGMRIEVRRDYIRIDSIRAIMSLSRNQLRQRWQIVYKGEAGLDAGGLTRDWFLQVTKAMFDPDMGLWQTSETNQMCLQINPASGIIDDDHLLCFRFLGRIMGKAMFAGELVKGHMVNHLYKHLLGWPVMFNDLKDIDDEYYNNLKKTINMGADVEHICADFTTAEEFLGTKQTVELVKNGAEIDVTEDNLPEYIEACLKYRLLGRYQAQLSALILGFYDVLPEPLLTIFDFQELEMLMCGFETIEMDDWMENTVYTGQYREKGSNHEVCVWFWEVVSEYDEEMKARLLQFVTGTSGVPSTGFGSLQGYGGAIKKFTIMGVGLDSCVYPKSHTCFNRIDLPVYGTKDELEEKLKIAVTMCSTGFEIE
mmetsp:Transcript_13622/g.29459  ORF Transcript_13622/g.29459 Transcript_13622/m.29459 type:complete len:738 (-) Transcript_13622:180-2393(-)